MSSVLCYDVKRYHEYRILVNFVTIVMQRGSAYIAFVFQLERGL